MLQRTNQFSENVISQSAKGDWKLVMGEMLQSERCALKCQKQIHKLLDSSLEVLAAISLRPSAQEEIALNGNALKEMSVRSKAFSLINIALRRESS
jgi:hypothetical protein